MTQNTGTEAQAAHDPIEAECRQWRSTREKPHPAMPTVVRYVIRAGTPTWTGAGMVRTETDIVLDWPPTKEAYPGAAWNDQHARWEHNGSVDYLIEPVDLEMYRRLFAAGLLTPPPILFIDNRKTG